MARESSPPHKPIWALGIIGVLFFGAVLFWVLSPPVTPPISQARQKSCENNLRQLTTLLSIYSTQFGGAERRVPSELGKAFWLRLSQTNPPLIEGEEFGVLVCPASEEPPARSTTYRGPLKDVNSMTEGEVVGCCSNREHPNGMVFLLKGGKVVVLKGKEAERLLAQTRD